MAHAVTRDLFLATNAPRQMSLRNNRLVQHLKASPLSTGDQKMLIDAVSQTAAELARVQRSRLLRLEPTQKGLEAGKRIR
jgi:hypothetical protein